MFKRSFLTTAVSFLIAGLASHALAGPIVVGNSGKIIVCPEGSGQPPYELVDFYEARTLRGWKNEVIADSKDPVEVAGQVLSRIKTLNPSRFQRYERSLSTFMKEAQFLRGQELVDLPDSNHPSYPANCQVKQLAIQRSHLGPNEARYLINGDVWEKLDLESKTGLILHEVIYRELILAGVHTSESVRFLNAALWSYQMKSMDQATYVKFIQDAMPDADFDGYNFAICRPGWIEGQLQPCARREPPRIFWDSEKSSWNVRGFLPPPWAPWAMNENQYMKIVDPISKKEMSILTYGPFQKDLNSTVYSPVISWIPRVGENQFDYAGHTIRPIGNKYVDPKYITNKRDAECFEIWSCEAPELDDKDDGFFSPRNWSRHTVTAEHVLLNFYVEAMTIREGYQARSCKGLVNLFKSGNLKVCNAYGKYENEQMKLDLEKSFMGFDENKNVEFAHALPTSMIRFNDHWIKVRTVSWIGPEGKRIPWHFTAEQNLSLTIWSQHLLVERPFVRFNGNGELVSIKAKKPMKFRIGRKTLETDVWALATDVYMDAKKFPEDARFVRLASDIILKSADGTERTYRAKSNLIMNDKGQVYQCEDALGSSCF